MKKAVKLSIKELLIIQLILMFTSTVLFFLTLSEIMSFDCYMYTSFVLAGISIPFVILLVIRLIQQK